MEIKEFIATLKKSNFSLAVENEKLILKGDSKKLTKSDIQAIKNNEFVINYIKDNKNELLKYLSIFPEEFLAKEKSKNISAIYRLSGLQQGMLFYSLYDGESGAYVEQFSCDLVGVDLKALTGSWDYILKAHSILRSAFFHDEFNVPVQCVYREVDLPIEILDYRGLSEVEQNVALRAYEDADRIKGFDLKNPPLMRIGLIRLSEIRYRMFWTSHHLLYDGWSLPILIEEFLKTYESLYSGKQVTLGEEDRYEDFIRYLERNDRKQEENYWRSYMAGVEQNTLLPFISATDERTKGVGHYKSLLYLIERDIVTKIEDYARKCKLTVNTVMQGVWSLLLHHYTESDNVIYGTTVSGRPDDFQV